MQFEALLQGTNFRTIEAKVRADELEEGHALTLERDPGNEFDHNAIKVIDPDTEIWLGFVAKEVAAELAPLMDRGDTTVCAATQKMPAKNGFKWLLSIGVIDDGVDLEALTEA